VISELSNSHTYVGGGDDLPAERRVPTAFIGADFALDSASGRYRLAKIYRGDNTASITVAIERTGTRSARRRLPAAVDEVELKAPIDPYSLLVGKQDGTVKLTVSLRPTAAPRPGRAAVKKRVALAAEGVDRTQPAQVDRLSGGGSATCIVRHVMRSHGSVRPPFYPQLDKQALTSMSAERGAFIDQIVLERLRRLLVGMDTNRNRTPTTIRSRY